MEECWRASDFSVRPKMFWGLGVFFAGFLGAVGGDTNREERGSVLVNLNNLGREEHGRKSTDEENMSTTKNQSPTLFPQVSSYNSIRQATHK